MDGVDRVTGGEGRIAEDGDGSRERVLGSAMGGEGESRSSRQTAAGR